MIENAVVDLSTFDGDRDALMIGCRRGDDLILINDGDFARVLIKTANGGVAGGGRFGGIF